MLRQLFARPTKRAIQVGGTILLAGAMVCGSVPAHAIGSVKPRQATPIAQPNEPAVTCSDRADYDTRVADLAVSLSSNGLNVQA